MIQQILTLGCIVFLFAACRPGGESIDKTTKEGLVYQPGSKVSFDSENPNGDPPLFTADASLICSDLSFYNRDGQLVEGTRDCSGSLPSCGDQTQTFCVATETHPAVSKTELEAKVMAGQSIAGISGTAVLDGYEVCSSDGAASCVATTSFKALDISLFSPGDVKSGVTIAGQTGAFPSASYPLSGATATADLTNFISQLKTDGSFEFWDSSGQRYTGSGDSDIVAANVKEGVSFENLSITGILPTMPIVTPTNLSGTYTSGPDRVELSWDDMSMVGYLLIAREGAAVNWAPTNGQSYSTGSQGANEIIYVGSSQAATHSGITAGYTYHYALYAYNANDFYSATPVTISVDTGPCSSLAGGTWVAVPGDADYC